MLMETNKLTEVFNALQKDGINARIKNRNETLLIWAVSEGYTDIALALIKAGAKLDETNNDGNTALIRAACENRVELARALIGAKANLNIQNESGYTALILAKRRGNMEIYDLLVEEKADDTFETKRGATAATTIVGESTKDSLVAPRDAALEQKIIRAIEIS